MELNQLTIINLCTGLGVLLIYGLWKGKDQEYTDIEVGTIVLLLITITLTNNLLELCGLFLGLIISILGYSIIIDKTIDGIKNWELPIMKIFVILGYIIIVTAQDFLYLYIGIETISLTFYLLAGIKTSFGGVQQQEASLKYFILGSLGSGLLLFGIVWIYKESGTLNFLEVEKILDYNSNSMNYIGPIFIILAILLKMAAAPLHMWAPDVYEGSPTYITSIFAIYPKIVYVYVLYELLSGVFNNFQSIFSNILILSGLLSIGIGSIGAINQTRMKRFIAYSGISHTGWILLGIGTYNIFGIVSSIIYLIIYIIMNINTFSIILSYSTLNISQFTGFLRSHPLLSSFFSLNLMSMAGIPPLLGFVSKVLILFSLYITNNIVIAIVALILSIIGAFNYIRIIKTMAFLTPKYLSPDAFSTVQSQSLALLIAATSWFIITGIFLTFPVVSIILSNLFI